MKRANIVSLALLIGYIPVNIGIIFGIVAVDNWILVSVSYVVWLGVIAPLLVLVPFWIFISKMVKSRNSFILAGVATFAILIGGGMHFFIFAIASASV